MGVQSLRSFKALPTEAAAILVGWDSDMIAT
jgi:hypothetical protein